MKTKIITNTYLRDVDKHQIKLYLDEDDYYVSVKKLVHVTDKFIINNGNTIAMDNGYYIVEIIPKNEKYAMRVFLNDKKEAIMLVPEISLTPQIISTFQKRFGQNLLKELENTQ